MQNLWLRLLKFLTEDVKNEYESKDTAVLLRLLTLLSSFYVIFSGLYFALTANYFCAVSSFLFLGLFVGVFIETYENGTMKALTIYIVSSIVEAIVFSIFSGWNKGFQWIVCICLLTIFFSTEISIDFKKKNIGVLIALLCVVGIISNIVGNYKIGKEAEEIIFCVISSLYYGGSFGVIGYAYNKKFNSSEEKLRNYNTKLQQMASLDALTGLANRRSMNEYISSLTFEKDKVGDVYSIAIADLDFFKKINDNYGHDAGDFVLKTMASIFEKTMEGRGKVARWGGEEFLFCFDDLLIDQAYKVLEEMRKEIENKVFLYKGEEIHLTITIGLEEYYHISGIEGTISKADVKLYNGKSAGRNRVIM